MGLERETCPGTECRRPAAPPPCAQCAAPPGTRPHSSSTRAGPRTPPAHDRAPQGGRRMQGLPDTGVLERYSALLSHSVGCLVCETADSRPSIGIRNWTSHLLSDRKHNFKAQVSVCTSMRSQATRCRMDSRGRAQAVAAAPSPLLRQQCSRRLKRSVQATALMENTQQAERAHPAFDALPLRKILGRPRGEVQHWQWRRLRCWCSDSSFVTCAMSDASSQ